MMVNQKYTANQDIRDYMADHGVSQRMLAAQMDTNIYKINTMLKKELSEKEKEDLIRQIDAIEEARHETMDAAEPAAPEEVEEPAEAAAPEEPEEEEESADESISTKFQIGDRVKIPSKSLCIGIVSDIWHSLAQDKLMYAVDVEGGGRGLYGEHQLEPAPLPIEYTFNATIEDNVAVVCMIAKQGDRTWVHARGHAHILHDGEVGMAQAVSYASKRMFESLDTAQGKQIYFKNKGGYRNDH